MNLQQIGEFGLIRRIQKRFPPSRPAVLLGIGDDAAAILPSPGKHLLLTTDSLLEETHFDLSLSTFYQVGYKAISVNISDIAAMGGVPLYFLISLGLTARQTVDQIDDLYRGIKKGSGEVGVDLIGGNTTHSNETFFISLTVVGEAPLQEIVTRAGARAGDFLYVTGTLGDSAAGLDVLQKGIEAKPFLQLIRRYQTPQPRWREGRLLAQERVASAMIDLSDGLTSDLSHLMEQGRVGAEVDLTRIPLSAALRRYALQTGNDPLKYALNGGEDYELLFAVPGKKVKTLEGLIRKGLIQARRIGAFVQRGKGLTARGPTGRAQKIKAGGYDHFKKKGGKN